MSKKSKFRREQFEVLTRPQLIALAVQKRVLPYKIADAMTKDQLVSHLISVEGALTPEQA